MFWLFYFFWEGAVHQLRRPEKAARFWWNVAVFFLNVAVLVECSECSVECRDEPSSSEPLFPANVPPALSECAGAHSLAPNLGCFLNFLECI